MATVVDEANAYFPSISNLAAKVFADVELVKQACVANGEWEELSVEEQELITDQVLIDSQVSDRFSSTAHNSEFPDCFPVLKVNSGEKIVVDFDHDDVCVTVVLLFNLVIFVDCSFYYRCSYAQRTVSKSNIFICGNRRSQTRLSG